MNSLRRQQAFVLITTLWILAGLGLLAGFVHQAATGEVEAATARKSLLQDNMARDSLTNTLAYMLSTGRVTDAGLVLENPQWLANDHDGDIGHHASLEAIDGVLRFDGSTHLGPGDLRWSVVDEGGLASVTSPNAPPLEAMLRSVGVSEAKTAIILARLLDYQDQDHDTRLNGAEFGPYVRAEEPYPPNRLLVSPLEMTRLLDFYNLVSPDQWHALKPYLTMRQFTGMNLKVMDETVLAAVLGVPKSELARLFRDATRLDRADAIEEALGRYINVPLESLRRFPSRFIRIAVWRQGDTRRLISGVEITPSGQFAPFRRDYVFTEQIHGVDSNVAESIRSPLLQ